MHLKGTLNHINRPTLCITAAARGQPAWCPLSEGPLQCACKSWWIIRRKWHLCPPQPKKKRKEKNFVKWANFQNGLALLTNYLGDLTLWPRFTSYPCHCAIDHFNIFYLPVDLVAEWQGCLKLFDCSDKEESANLGLKLESKFFSVKSGFFALLNAES